MTELGFLTEDNRVIHYDSNNELFQKNFLPLEDLELSQREKASLKEHGNHCFLYQRLEMVNIDEIFDSNGDPPSFKEEYKISPAVEMIDKYQAIAPVLLERIEDCYVIIDGTHRRAAAKEKGYNKIPAFVVRKITCHSIDSKYYRVFL